MAIQRVSLREANQHLSKYIEVGGLMSDAEKCALERERSRARMRQGYSLGGGSLMPVWPPDKLLKK